MVTIDTQVPLNSHERKEVKINPPAEFDCPLAKPPVTQYSYGKHVKAKSENLRELSTMDSEPCVHF